MFTTLVRVWVKDVHVKIKIKQNGIKNFKKYFWQNAVSVRLSYADLKTIKSFVVFIFEDYQYSSASDYRDMKDVLNGVSFHENLKL